MLHYGKTAAVLAAATVLAFGAAAARAEPMGTEAAKLRKLDIMLMVGSLRCRFGEDNYQPDYERFAAAQTTTMTAAHRELEAEYTARMGAKGAKKALDTLSVGMANQYGQGHPWLGCTALKTMTQDLALTTDRARLVSAANYALADGPTIAMAGSHRGN